MRAASSDGHRRQVFWVTSATVVTVASPPLARDLGAGGAEQQWVIDASCWSSRRSFGPVDGREVGWGSPPVAGAFVAAAVLGLVTCRIAAAVGRAR